MILVLLINLVAVGFAAVASNNLLATHSYILYGLQLLTMMPYLASRAVFLKNAFLPSFFVLLYTLVSLTLGAYLVPREHGFYTEYTAVLLDIQNYAVIVPYLMLTNIVLFLLTVRAFRKVNRLDGGLLLARADEVAAPRWLAVFKLLFFFAAFIAVSNLDFISVFPLQMALMIVHLTDSSLRRRYYRYGVYAFYLGALVVFTFQNKREIAMALFLIVFLEAYYSRNLLKLNIRNVAIYVVAFLAFMCLVMTASILRGYGDFPVSTIFDALGYVPRYILSDIFIDAITDNLELNYFYGAAIASIDLGLTNDISYQLGASFAKVFFLPIPRELFPAKPESIMQIYTQVYAPAAWDNDGSLPVSMASEMFLNFHYFGLLSYAGLWWVINRLFIRFHTLAAGSLGFYSCIFLFITVLSLARGSGLELYVLYYLLALPLLFFLDLVFKFLRRGFSSNATGVSA